MATHKPKKDRPCDSAGSLALLHTRMRTGAGKTTDRRPTRQDERAQWMEDQRQ